LSGMKPQKTPLSNGPSKKDFDAAANTEVASKSAAFDPERPYLFDGLQPRYTTRVIKSVFIPMRDGVQLSTDLYIPVGAELPLPVILSRTPYGKNGKVQPLARIFPEQGLIFAVQDVRGRYESEGEFIACTGQDREDGYDTVTWLAEQDWCNGSVGAIGSSYVGETAAKLAATCHPNHKASVIMFDGAYAGGRVFNGAYWQYGVNMLRMLFVWFRDYVPKISYGPPAHVDRQEWFRAPYASNYVSQPINQPEIDVEAHLRTLPLVDMMDRAGAAPSEYEEFIRRSENPADPYWRQQGFLAEDDEIDSPAMHISGFQEQGGSGPQLWSLFRRKARSALARDNQVWVFSPSPHSQAHLSSEHTTWGVRDFGDTRFPYYRKYVEWFGHWLRGDANDVEQWPKAHWYVAGRNQWEQGAEFPPPDSSELRLYLRSDGRLSSLAPDSEESPDSYQYDPADPTPSEPPGADKDLIGIGFADRSGYESRPDVLAYTTEKLAGPLEIAGRVKLMLQVSSSAKDTDFAAVLCERNEAGQVINVCHGIMRMRWRESLEQPVWMEAGKVYEIELDMWFATMRFERGSRISLQIMSASFPAFERNLNTGESNYTSSDWVVANNSIHHSPSHLSYITLPARSTESRVI
jgi:putative CocE/NonD family hydrolase